MFGFGKGGSASQDRTTGKESRLNSSISIRHTIAPELSLEPAIDGPPSPERIRAYMEQMKRSSVFGHRTRSDTANTSGSFPLQSGESSNASQDRVLSRKSSTRSNSSSMAPRGERPESMHLFTKTIFSRSRKSSFKSNASSTTLPSLGASLGGINEVSSARDRYYGKSKQNRKEHGDGPENPRKTSISGPYNFQHVTHTHKEHLPNIEKASKVKLASEFSAIRASQMPTSGELKGIRAEELHFENFSSEALHEEYTKSGAPEWSRPRTSPTQRRKPNLRVDMPPSKTLNHSYSNESMDTRRRTPPPRPPRSPLSPECSVPLPPRVSSRTASGYFDAFTPSEAPQQRPHTAGRARGLVYEANSPPPLQPTWNITWEQAGQFANKDLPARPLVSPPVEEAWPLTSSVESFGAELPIVPEKESIVVRRRGSSNTRGPEIRWSKSFPDFYTVGGPKIKTPQFDVISEQPERPRTRDSETGGSETLGASAAATSTVQESPHTTSQRTFSKLFGASHDDWEDDIDYCYEHEAEADCHFEWKRNSIAEEDYCTEQSTSMFAEGLTLDQPSYPRSPSPTAAHYYSTSPSPRTAQFYATSPSPKSVPRPRSPHAHDDDHSPIDAELKHELKNRFRSSLLVPSSVDVPELSPMSMNSPEPELRTPSNAGHLHPMLGNGGHHRSPSYASSFKESQGFNLSPSLLIPNDFGSQMEQERLYEKLIDSNAMDDQVDPFIFNPGGTSGNRESMIMEGSSARSSYRSSGFSRGSVSFRSSDFSKNNSRESVVLLSRNSTASYSGSTKKGHFSVQSAGSLPELVVSSRRDEKDERSESEESVTTTKVPEPDHAEEPADEERERINELLRERELHMINAPTPTATEEHLINALSPVTESFNFLGPVAGDFLSPIAESFLSPVAESFVESHNSLERISSDEKPVTALAPTPQRDLRTSVSISNLGSQNHGRKSSAPVISPPFTKPALGTRQRSASSAANLVPQGNKTPRRGSYMLFPQSTQS